MVFPRLRKVILVHGCFWHKHDCKFGSVVPKSNGEFWEKKRNANVLRDIRVVEELESLGWCVKVIWECETREPSRLMDLVSGFLTC